MAEREQQQPQTKVCPECEGLGYVINDLEDLNDEKYDFIYRCIVCKVYSTDSEAALVLSMASGKELRWAIPPGETVYQPHLSS